MTKTSGDDRPAPRFHVFLREEIGDRPVTGESKRLGFRRSYLWEILSRSSYPLIPNLRSIGLAYEAPEEWIEQWQKEALASWSAKGRIPGLQNPFSRWLMLTRENKGLTRREVAARTLPKGSPPSTRPRRAGSPFRQELEELPLSVNTIAAYERGVFLPRRKVLMRIEDALGERVPQEVQSFISRQRRRQYGERGRHMHRVVRGRVSKWNRQRLSKEITQLLGQDMAMEVRQALTLLPYNGQVGGAGYDVYLKAVNTKRARALSPESRQRGLAVGRDRSRGASPRKDLAFALWSLKERIGIIFQCQGCGQLVRHTKRHQGRYARSETLCLECWTDYRKHSAYMQWFRGGAIGDPPALPRRGGRLLRSDDLRSRIMKLLRHRLGKPQELEDGPLLDEDFKQIYDVERRLKASSDTWCQRIAKLLSGLSNTP